MELIEFLAGQIRGLIKNKVFREIDPVIAARSFMGMVLHYSLAQEIYGLKKYFKTPNKNVIEAFIKIFFEGMTRR